MGAVKADYQSGCSDAVGTTARRMAWDRHYAI